MTLILQPAAVRRKNWLGFHGVGVGGWFVFGSYHRWVESVGDWVNGMIRKSECNAMLM